MLLALTRELLDKNRRAENEEKFWEHQNYGLALLRVTDLLTFNFKNVTTLTTLLVPNSFLLNFGKLKPLIFEFGVIVKGTSTLQGYRSP